VVSPPTSTTGTSVTSTTCSSSCGRRSGPIGISTEYAEVKPGGPLNVTLTVNDSQLASGTVPVSAPLLFTANDCLDIGVCLGGRVSLDYWDRAPFAFNGTIKNVNVRYTS
jgi:hypothetical protein